MTWGWLSLARATLLTSHLTVGDCAAANPSIEVQDRRRVAAGGGSEAALPVGAFVPARSRKPGQGVDGEEAAAIGRLPEQRVRTLVVLARAGNGPGLGVRGCDRGRLPTV